MTPMIADRGGRRAAGNRWLVIPRPNERAALRLFCFPYSGAGASIFHAWAEGLPPQVEVCGVQLPGRESRLGEPPFTHMEDLAPAVAEGLAHEMDRPFALYGHSMGALVVFELARLLRRQGRPAPVITIVSGHGAPDLGEPDGPIHNLPEDEFVARLRKLDGMRPEVLENAELRQILLPILRADFSVCETYRYQPDAPLDCPLTAFGGLEDPYVDRERLAGWRAQTAAAFSLRMFPGGHFFLNTARSLVINMAARELFAALPAGLKVGG